MKNKKRILLLGIIVLVIIGSILCILLLSKDKLTKAVKLEGIKITDIEITNKNHVSKYQAQVKATKDIALNYINMEIKDKENKTIVILIGYVGKKLKKGETYKIEASTDADLSGAKMINYTIYTLDE